MPDPYWDLIQDPGGGAEYLLIQADNPVQIKVYADGHMEKVRLTAIQLKSLLDAMANDFAVCSNCMVSYHPKRAPNPNRRNFCPVCRERGAPKKHASRDHRKRSGDA